MTAGLDERCPRCGLGGPLSGLSCDRMRGPQPARIRRVPLSDRYEVLSQQSYWCELVCRDEGADDLCEDCAEVLHLEAEEPQADAAWGRPIVTVTGVLP